MEIIFRQDNRVPFYVSTGLVGIPHGFSTRLGGVSPAPWDSMNLGGKCGDRSENVDANFRLFCAAIGADPDSIVKNHQVHTDLVRPVTEKDIISSPALPGEVEADGLITDVPGLCLTIFSADCIPVLLCDRKKRVIAAAHAGWRGTALGIAGKAAKLMQEDYGCRPEDIIAAIGPGISPCCFETHADVPDGLRAGLGTDAEEYIRPLSGEKFSVDLKGANRRWLERAGLLPEHIAVCPACTACDGHHFWSHRRLGLERGSMAAMIQLPKLE